jgi:hypothetical protein
MAVTFIGDVHGWMDRLASVLARSAPPYVFMGDLIDRGPQSREVLDRVRDLCQAGAARCLLGNHEYAMVRGLGCEERGIPADPVLFQAWVSRFGGQAVLASFGVRAGAGAQAGLRAALGDRLLWVADLPWILRGQVDGQAWIAVHAGFDASPLLPQVAALEAGWRADDGAPPALFAKERALMVPDDLPNDTCVVSGHTPQPAPLVWPRRILCDTSGGLPRRPLSAVVFPSGEVIRSDC